MLDSENTTGEGTSTDGSAEAAGSTPTAPTRRRRAAARPAGPPTPSTSATTPTTSDPEAEPAGAADSPVKAPAAKTAKKTTRQRTRKTTAAADPAPAPGGEDAAGADTPQTPADGSAAKAPATRRRKAAAAPAVLFQAPEPVAGGRRKKATSAQPAADADGADADEDDPTDASGTADEADTTDENDESAEAGDGGDAARRRRRRRGGRGRRRRTGTDQDGGGDADDNGPDAGGQSEDGASSGSDGGSDDATAEGQDGDEEGSAGTRRRRRRRRKGADGDAAGGDDDTAVVHVREPRSRAKSGSGSGSGEVTAMRGSTRLEAKKQRRREGRDAGRRRPPILSEAEFLARREAVRRVMVVRQRADLTQIAVLEDDVLVEHYVASASSSTMVGNVYLGKVQNVLPSMEAAFVDIGRGRNAVLYAGEVNWDAAGLDGQPKRIEHVLKSGDSVLVQVTKDPMGHKGSRLTSNISLAGRFLVYVPDGSMSGISRKLPDKERSRLKAILKKVVPDDAGVIVRTAAEGATEEQLTHDVARLTAQWDDIEKKARTATAPELLSSEPDLTVRVVRDLFNEDFERLVVSGDTAWDTVQSYVGHVAPDLLDRVEKYVAKEDAFSAYRVDEQISKGLDRKVWLPSGGSLVIDRTEAMTVVDVNTGKFVGKGSGNLEETVTKNNLEAAEEIVRQLRLRDIGGIIVIDFIDMVLESNRELVLRRLTECLGRDRTKHQVAEVTSLGLVQMTRKRIGQGLLEAFSEPCEHCNGRGVKVHLEPVEARTGLRHSGENVDRVDRVARAAKAVAQKPSAQADGANGSAVGADTGADGKAPRARRSRAKAAAATPEPSPAAESKPAARPRRRATKAQGAPTPVG